MLTVRSTARIGQDLRRADPPHRPGRRRRRAARPRPARAADRDAAGPAVPDGARLRGAAAARRPARRRHAVGRRPRRGRPRGARPDLPGAAGAAPLPRLDGRPHAGPVPAAGRALRRPRRRTSGPTRRTAPRCCGASASCPGSARRRRRSSSRCSASSTASRRRAGGRPPATTAWRAPAGRSPTSPGRSRCVEVRAFKQEQKQAAKAAEAHPRSSARGTSHRADHGGTMGPGPASSRGRPRRTRPARGWMPVASSQQFPRSRRARAGADHRGRAEPGRAARRPEEALRAHDGHPHRLHRPGRGLLPDRLADADLRDPRHGAAVDRRRHGQRPPAEEEAARRTATTPGPTGCWRAAPTRVIDG